jgi:hypothetical protein
MAQFVRDDDAFGEGRLSDGDADDILDGASEDGLDSTEDDDEL